MFERYTEKARRVIFFARYEASQYGSLFIDTEHILLGLLREDRALMHRYVGPIHMGTEIRTEIEKVIKRGATIPTSVEVPLSVDSKRILKLAGEEADRLCHRHIGTEHILLGILRVENSLAARLLMAKGAKADVIREQVVRGSLSIGASTPPAERARTTLDEFLCVLKGGGSDQLSAFFDSQGQFIDSSGKRWTGTAEINKGAETLLAPFAKRNASFRVDATTDNRGETFLASVLWEFAVASGDHSNSLLRMGIVMAPAEKQWVIVSVQVTPVTFG
jgi:Clp amino terminal domain, pathogenicity island component